MAANLQELFVDVTGTESTTDRQAESSTSDPIADEEEAEVLEAVAQRATEDALADAVDGAEAAEE